MTNPIMLRELAKLHQGEMMEKVEVLRIEKQIQTADAALPGQLCFMKLIKSLVKGIAVRRQESGCRSQECTTSPHHSTNS